LISKGHPLGATGLAQCAELTWQLRGWANNRLVENAPVALQHNLGLGGAVVINVYKRADGKLNTQVSNEDIASKSKGIPIVDIITTLKKMLLTRMLSRLARIQSSCRS
jgi:sterol carrier protein 2